MISNFLWTILVQCQLLQHRYYKFSYHHPFLLGEGERYDLLIHKYIDPTLIFVLLWWKGEELRKLIGAPAYIECSSKTQQVYFLIFCLKFMDHFFSSFITQIVMRSWDDRT